jgi:hypothetical protein
MIRISQGKAIITLVTVMGAVSVLSVTGMAQTSSGAVPGVTPFGNNYHLGFERPEAWGLKYFASTTLLSGLGQPEPVEGHANWSVTVGFELGWLPTLDAGQTQIGFNGKAPQDLNKAPILVRPVVRVGLPWKLTAIIAAPPPFEAFGVRPHLLALGLERPLLKKDRWTLSWRGYGQVGSVKGAFTCPSSVLAFAPGSAGNPTSCVGESSDVSSLRYAGSEFEIAYRIPGMPKLIPHVAAGGNFIDGAIQLSAPVVKGLDETREWTRGGTFSGTAGATYILPKHMAFTVDAFYSPLWVTRNATAPRTNDGLFNVRAMLSYTLR